MTVETKCWAVEVDDGKIDLLMKAYDKACFNCHGNPKTLEVKMALEEALVAMGLLEDETEDEDEQEEPWDESKAREEAYWDMIDHKVDEMRDMALMGYEY